ncbi:TPA: type IVB secretion system protein IcmH/DotU [Salmonella enterica]
MTDSTLTPPAADMMSFLSTTPEHKDSEYETPVHTSQRTELNVIVEDGPDSKLRLAEISAAANPLLAAARPLLCALAAMPAKLDAALVEPYRNLLVREMHLYQTLCDQANLRREHVLAVRYCLCTALDEAANNTTWGRRGVWAGKSLLVTFHGESEGGIKLFQIIGRLAASFQEHGNVLEVIYHLLGLGFEGRYSVQPDGRKQLDNIRQQLLTQLSQRRDPVMPALSPDFQGAISGRLRRMRRVTEVAVTRGDTVRRYGYVYDAPGRRVEKHELDAEGKPYNRTTFLWDGMRLAQECRLGRSSSLYIYSDQGSHEPLARVDRAAPGEADEVLYYHTDVNGAPEEMTDGGGNIVWEAGYQVWGNLTHEKETRPVQQNLRFQGQYLDRETGLHYNLYRFYDPDIGKFISGDPIGLKGGLNQYAYAPNPLTYIDPLGLKCGFAEKNNITQRWVNKLTGKTPAEIDSLLTSKGWTKIYPQAGRPDAIQHIQYVKTTKSGTTYKLDYHPGGNAKQPNIHGNDYWKVYRANSKGEDIVYGRIGHGGFENYDLIKDSPVYVDGVLVNGGM